MAKLIFLLQEGRLILLLPLVQFRVAAWGRKVVAAGTFLQGEPGTGAVPRTFPAGQGQLL